MGTGLRNLFCSLTFTICFIHQINAAAAAQQKQQLPAVMVAGSVYCDTCFQQEFTAFSNFIPGASVAVKCNGFQKEVKTNQHGVFKMHLPLEVASRNVDTIKSCSVELVRSSWPFCSVASSATSAGLRLISKRNDVHVFSAGFFTFKPLEQPDVCNHKTKLSASAKYSLAGIGPKRMQSAFFFPPSIPVLPSPPNINGIPLPSNPFQPPSSILPPLPFQPSPPPFINVPPLSTPALIPVLPSPPNIKGIPLLSNPFQPPSSILPPLPFQPSPPPFLNVPPLPNIPPLPTLAPPPPPPPASIFPPLPFPPIFPGNPPAFPSPKLIKSYSLAT